MINLFWKMFAAFFQLDPKSVCEMSKGRGLYDDFHDYSDSIEDYPWHDMELTCKRCGKKFCI